MTDRCAIYESRYALPSLPVPPLAQTLERLLKTAAPLLTAAELEHAKALAAEFELLSMLLHPSIHQLKVKIHYSKLRTSY